MALTQRFKDLFNQIDDADIYFKVVSERKFNPLGGFQTLETKLSTEKMPDRINMPGSPRYNDMVTAGVAMSILKLEDGPFVFVQYDEVNGSGTPSTRTQIVTNPDLKRYGSHEIVSTQAQP